MRPIYPVLALVCLALAVAPPSQAQFTSTYEQVAVAGTFNNFNTFEPNMELVGDNYWQGYLTLSDESDARFKFATTNFVENDWGDISSNPFFLPINRPAVSRGSDIFFAETLNGTYRFRIQTDSLQYSVADVTTFEVTPGIWINEFHYDNTGADTEEGVEIAGTAGFSLANHKIYFYRQNGTVYQTKTLSGTIPDEGNGFGAIWFPRTGIQQGPNDGFALVKNDQEVIEFLSYEGPLTAVDGPAAGLAATEVPISEPSNTPIGRTLQLVGTGSLGSDFSWAGPRTKSHDLLSVGQNMVGTILATDVTVDSLSTDPLGPKAGDTVRVLADVTPVNGASNLVATLFWRVGATNSFNPIPMVTTNTSEFVTTSPIPGQPVGAVIEYYIHVLFDGAGTAAPVISPISFFGISRIPQGNAWINEVNYSPLLLDPNDQEFIEIMAVAGSDLSNWSVELSGPSGPPYATYHLDRITGIRDEFGGFGIYVVGDSGVANVDQVFTNEITSGNSMTESGVIRLLSEFGSPAFVYTYGDPPPAGVVGTYIGHDEEGFFDDSVLALTGSGSNAFGFAWTTNTVASPGQVNAAQTLTDGETAPLPIIYCPSNLTLQCLSDVPPPSLTNLLAEGLCSPFGVTVSYVGDTTNNATGCAGDPIEIERVYQAVSDCNTTNTCVQIITVEDTTPPGLICDIAGLQNPGFETGDLTGWTAFTPNPASVFAQLGSLSARTGFYKLVTEASVSGGGPFLLGAQQDLASDAGVEWTASIHASVPSIAPITGANSGYLELQFLDNSGGALSSITSTPVTAATPTDVYQRLLASGVSPAGTATARVRAVLSQQTQDNGQVLFDDAFLSKFAIVATNATCDIVLPDYTGLVDATDNCGTPTLTQTPLPGTELSQGTLNVTLRAIDCGGLSTSCVVTVTLLEDTPPDIICPTGIAVSAFSSCQGQVPDMSLFLEASDNCSSLQNLTFVQDVAPGTLVSIGSTVDVAVTVLDIQGNTTNCVVPVYAEDSLPPDLTCPANVTVESILDVPSINTGLVQVIEDCGTYTVTHLGDADNGASGTFGDPLIISRIYQAIDDSGNVGTCEQIITVEGSPGGAPTVDIVEFQIDSQVEITSLGTNTWDLYAEYNTNLVETPQTWINIPGLGNNYTNGTNYTTFPNPLPTRDYLHFRVRQEQP